MFVIPSSHTEIDTRGWKVKEASLLMNRKKLADGSALNEVMQACVPPEINVQELLLGDRMTLLVHLRIQTLGPEFLFRSQCPFCEQVQVYSEDLSKLPVKLLEPPLPLGEDRLREFVLPVSGAKVKYRYLRGKHEASMKTLRTNQPDEIMQIMLRLRVTEVDGNRLVPLSWFGELEAADAQALFDDMQDNDCGIETQTECTCPNCGGWYELDLPILSRDFFMPQTRKPSKGSLPED